MSGLIILKMKYPCFYHGSYLCNLITFFSTVQTNVYLSTTWETGCCTESCRLLIDIALCASQSAILYAAMRTRQHVLLWGWCVLFDLYFAKLGFKFESFWRKVGKIWTNWPQIWTMMENMNTFTFYHCFAKRKLKCVWSLICLQRHLLNFVWVICLCTCTIPVKLKRVGTNIVVEVFCKYIRNILHNSHAFLTSITPDWESIVNLFLSLFPLLSKREIRWQSC